MRDHAGVGHRRAEPAAPLLGVTGVDARDGHADAYLAGAGLGVGQFADVQHVVGRALCVVPGSKHEGDSVTCQLADSSSVAGLSRVCVAVELRLILPEEVVGPCVFGAAGEQRFASAGVGRRRQASESTGGPAVWSVFGDRSLVRGRRSCSSLPLPAVHQMVRTRGCRRVGPDGCGYARSRRPKVAAARRVPHVPRPSRPSGAGTDHARAVSMGVA